MVAKQKLKPLDEKWKRALAVVAHPDDLKYGAASAVARWTSQGKQITYIQNLAGNFDPEAFLRNNASAAGKSFGCQYAVGFEVMKI